ncbi:MAG TPA: type II secretion system protein GspM [Candidatus Binatia bacterium]
MRDILANLIARLRATNRQQRLYLALAVVLLLVVARFSIAWFLEMRANVKEEIRLSAQRLAAARRLVQRAPETQKEYETLQARYQETVAELVPGDTPTLAAAALQDRVSALASEKKVSLQTTQVLKDEALGPFRQVSLRITASGELHDLADFLANLEFGPLRVSIPFIELSRRGAVVRRQQPAAGRTVSATIQISGVVQGTAQLAAAPQGASRAAGNGAEGANGDADAAPTTLSEAAPAGPPPPPPPAQLGQRPAAPRDDEERPPVPDDPLGTSNLVTPP